jgi:oligopeptide transport system permease protein
MKNCDILPKIKTAKKTAKQKNPSYWKDSWRRFKSNNRVMFGFWLLCFFIAMAIVAPFCTKYAYYETHLPLKNLPPSWNFLFGTDELGRDIFTRIWWGARISLFVGITAAIIDLAIGTIYGAIAGFYGGKIDECMMRITDIIYSIPYLLMAILLTVILGCGLKTMILALSIAGWIPMARITRGQILQLKTLDFVRAAYALGASKSRILLHHLLPNALGSIITMMTLTIPAAIFTEAFLSFLGLGVQAPIASWGTMASESVSALRYFPWRLIFPATFISLTMLAFNLVGDGIRDAFDPRLKE